MFRLKAKEIYDQYILNDKLAAITTERYRIDLVKKCNEIEKVSFQIQYMVNINLLSIFYLEF